VTWKNLVNATAAGAQLTKTSGCGTCSNAGGVTQEAIATSGSMTFTVNTGTSLVVGLGNDTTSNTSYAIDYAFSFNGSATFEIREKGVYKSEGKFSATDVFRISVAAGVVKYYRNDVLVYTSKTAATSPLVGDSSLQTVGAVVTVVSFLVI